MYLSLGEKQLEFLSLGNISISGAFKINFHPPMEESIKNKI